MNAWTLVLSALGAAVLTDIVVEGYSARVWQWVKGLTCSSDRPGTFETLWKNSTLSKPKTPDYDKIRDLEMELFGRCPIDSCQTDHRKVRAEMASASVKTMDGAKYDALSAQEKRAWAYEPHYRSIREGEDPYEYLFQWALSKGMYGRQAHQYAAMYQHRYTPRFQTRAYGYDSHDYDWS